MRFINEYPNDGEEKVVVKFLWLPLKIQNETRWLEFAHIKKRAKLINNKFKWYLISFENK